MKPIFKQFFSALIVLGFLFLAFGSEETKEEKSSENKENTTEKKEEFSIDPQQLSELNSYLQKGPWTCTSVESGTAPFMKGATFLFNNHGMTVSSEGTVVENKMKITGIIPNTPEGCRYSALIDINGNKDMLTWIDDGLMILSWGGDKAKLRLQR